MKGKLFSTIVLSLAGLAVLSIAQGRAWAAGSTIKPSTGIAEVVVASAKSCTNVFCETGDSCTFETFIGAAQTFTSFGSGLSKATLLGCIAINTTDVVSVGSGANAESTCAPATGTFILTSTAKAGGIVTLGYAGQVCTLPTDANKQVLSGAYILTASTVKQVTSASGQVNSGYSIKTGNGAVAFNGDKNFTP